MIDVVRKNGTNREKNASLLIMVLIPFTLLVPGIPSHTCWGQEMNAQVEIGLKIRPVIVVIPKPSPLGPGGGWIQTGGPGTEFVLQTLLTIMTNASEWSVHAVLDSTGNVSDRIAGQITWEVLNGEGEITRAGDLLGGEPVVVGNGRTGVLTENVRFLLAGEPPEGARMKDIRIRFVSRTD